MTNEEKANELIAGDESINISTVRLLIKDKVLEMAKWKDNQLQSMLNGLSPSIRRIVIAVGEETGINFDNFY